MASTNPEQREPAHAAHTTPDVEMRDIKGLLERRRHGAHCACNPCARTTALVHHLVVVR